MSNHVVPGVLYIYVDMKDCKLFTGYFICWQIREYFLYLYRNIYDTIRSCRPGRIFKSLWELILTPMIAYKLYKHSMETNFYKAYDIYCVLSKSNRDFMLLDSGLN